MAEGGDKSEKATPQRLREARKRGDVASSPEFAMALVALVGLFALQSQGGHIVDGLLALLSQDLVGAARAGSMTTTAISAHLRDDVVAGLLLLAPLVAVALVAALVVGVLNTRGLVSFKGVTPSLGKLNPLHGAKRLFSKDGLVLLVKAFVKLTLAAALVGSWSPAWQALVTQLPFMTTGAACAVLWQDALQVALQIAAVYAVIGALDFGYRYYTWNKRLRMTKEEVKQEFKQSEGNPQVRSRMRQNARKRLKALMNGTGIRRVPEADVIITNPTHFAVAISYKAGKMRAPRVIAKGQNLAAQRIKETARTHTIPIVENKPLAQALFKSVDVNKEIPADLYQAVAQVLAFVYRMKSPAPPPQPPLRGRPRPAQERSTPAQR